MNDEIKRLMELAAVSIGIKLEWRETSMLSQFVGLPSEIPGVYVSGEFIGWNPHDDDGDSRRLQAATGIALSFIPGEIASAVAKHQQLPKAFSERIAGDAPAAARMAVLRAAAALGEQMQGLCAGHPYYQLSKKGGSI